jgi:surface antigen
VFFNWDGGRVDHVGIVESVNGDGSIYTIEGNTSNNIVERRHRKSMIAGYGRPHYR